MNCNRPRYGTGVAYPSSSVLFTGQLPEFISSDVTLPCDANLDEIVERMNDELQLLIDGNDLTELDKKCFDFDPSEVKINELHQLEIDKICSLETTLNELVDTVEDLDIGSKIIEIDLDCLTPEAAPCAVGTNMYSLISILNILINEICLLKQ